MAYLAPEILTRQGHGRTVDLYGLGVCPGQEMGGVFFFFFWDSYSDLVTFSDLVFLGDFFGDFFVDLFSWFLNGNFWVFDFAWKDRDMES